jgi:hypothetical protein
MVVSPSYIVKPDLGGDFSIMLRIPGYSGTYVTSKLLRELEVSPARGKADETGRIIFKKEDQAVACATRVDRRLTEDEEV